MTSRLTSPRRAALAAAILAALVGTTTAQAAGVTYAPSTCRSCQVQPQGYYNQARPNYYYTQPQRPAYYAQPAATYAPAAQPTYTQPAARPVTYAQPAAQPATYTANYAQPAAQPATYAQPVQAAGDPYGFTNWLNGVRAQYGLSAVGYDQNLTNWAAMNNAQQNARGIGHFVMGPARRQNSAMGGYGSIGSMWMNSPGHRAALLDPSIRWIGLAGSGMYWTFNAR